MTSCNIENDMDTESRRLLNRDKQFARMSVDGGAAEAFKHFLTEEAMALAPNQYPVFGREKLYQEMKPGQALYVLDWKPQRAEVSASEDMGWTWGTYTLTGQDKKGVERISYGKYLNIWERQDDGQWLVVVDMGNTSPAPIKA